MKIKICGITRVEDAQLCVEHGVDAIGFIFYPKSKRYISPEKAKDIASTLPIFTHKIGVFVDEDIEEVNRIAKLVGLSGVQLHGNETVEYISQITHPVIKSFGVDETFDFSILNNYSNCGILLDVKDPEQYGGTGNSFNWDLIPKEIRHKVIIAGGVGINNIENISKNISPYAVDLSSSVEIEHGIKDIDKLKKLFKKYNELRKF
jgi:phosphoribosylanthranilate isomerase